MNEKKGLVIDTLSLDSFIVLITRRYFKKYQKIYFCRQTKIGAFLYGFLPKKLKEKFSQLKEAMSETFIDGVSLAKRREELIDSLMRVTKLKKIHKLSALTGASQEKLRAGFVANSWKAYHYQAEAVVWADYYNYDGLTAWFLGYKRRLSENSNVYRKIIDYSAIVARKNYSFETCYEFESTLKTLLKGLLSYSLALVHFPVSKLKKGKLEKKQIAVQILKKNVDLHKRSDLYWMNDSKLLDSLLLLLSFNPNMVGNAKRASVVNLSSGLREKNSIFKHQDACAAYLKTFIKFIKLTGYCLFIRREPSLIPWLKNIYLYQAVFEIYGIKVFLSNGDLFNSSFSLACDASKVVYARSTWSNLMYPHTYLMSSADVFFGWGDAVVDGYVRSGSKRSCFVNTGFAEKPVVNFKENKRKDSKQFVIGFFDNATSFDLINSCSHLKSCFLMLRDLLNEFDCLKVIYKPKSGDESELEKLNLLGELSDYIKNKRIVILQGQRGYDNTAMSISQTFDLVLGYPISSAATEAMINGVPAFHMNLSGRKEHYWENNNFDYIIFYSVEEAKKKLSMYIKDPTLILKPSDKLLKTVNHFNDFNAKERMQNYIEFLCEGEGVEVEQRIQNANKKYYQLGILNKQSFTAENLEI